MFGSYSCINERSFILFYYIYLSLIYFIYNFLGTDFPALKTNHQCCKNRSVFGCDWAHKSSFILIGTDYIHSAKNNILNPGSHRDHIIPLFGGHFKIWVVSLYMPKNPVSHHGWETKKILQFGLSKTAFSAIFHTIFYSKI